MKRLLLWLIGVALGVVVLLAARILECSLVIPLSRLPKYLSAHLYSAKFESYLYAAIRPRIAHIQSAH